MFQYFHCCSSFPSQLPQIPVCAFHESSQGKNCRVQSSWSNLHWQVWDHEPDSQAAVCCEAKKSHFKKKESFDTGKSNFLFGGVCFWVFFFSGIGNSQMPELKQPREKLEGSRSVPSTIRASIHRSGNFSTLIFILCASSSSPWLF